MNHIRTSFKKYRKILLFLSIVFIIGILSGVFYFNFVKDSIVVNLEAELVSLNFNSNNFVFHSLILSIIIIFSLLIIGSVLGVFIYFYEAMSIGFILGAFFSYFGFSGFIYGLLYCLVIKGFYIVCFTFVLIKIFNLSKNIVGYFLLKKDGSLKEMAISNFITIIKILILVIANDLLLMLLGDYVLEMFSFLIGK